MSPQKLSRPINDPQGNSKPPPPRSIKKNGHQALCCGPLAISCRRATRGRGQKRGALPLSPAYASADAGASAEGWMHHQHQQVMPRVPPAGPYGMPDCWQHAGWPPAAEARGFAQQSAWSHQLPAMSGGYAMPSQLSPQQLQYFAAAHASGSAGGQQLQQMPQQHQGRTVRRAVRSRTLSHSRRSFRCATAAVPHHALAPECMRVP